MSITSRLEAIAVTCTKNYLVHESSTIGSWIDILSYWGGVGSNIFQCGKALKQKNLWFHLAAKNESRAQAGCVGIPCDTLECIVTILILLVTGMAFMHWESKQRLQLCVEKFDERSCHYATTLPISDGLSQGRLHQCEVQPDQVAVPKQHKYSIWFHHINHDKT